MLLDLLSLYPVLKERPLLSLSNGDYISLFNIIYVCLSTEIFLFRPSFHLWADIRKNNILILKVQYCYYFQKALLNQVNLLTCKDTLYRGSSMK